MEKQEVKKIEEKENFATKSKDSDVLTLFHKAFFVILIPMKNCSKTGEKELDRDHLCDEFAGYFDESDEFEESVEER